MFAERADLIFYELAALLLLASVAGIAAMRLKQPLIMAFIFAGVLASLPVVPSQNLEAHLKLLSNMGVTLLLFVVGLRLDISMVRTLGRVALATGIGQIVFTSAIGFGLCLLLGLDRLTAAYVAVALTFSSTIIIVKLLSDKREIDSLHGRIAIGFLIVQDIAVIIAMILLSSFAGAEAEKGIGSALSDLFLRGVAFLVVFALLARFVLPRLLNAISRSMEMLILFSISWAICVASASGYLGFSKEVGAFLAGVAIASTQYRDTVGAHLTSLRDFLLLFFFVDLGANLELSLLGEQVLPAVVLSAFVLIGNPLIVMVIMGKLGYRSRTSFLAGLTVAQISEFSLILAALGLRLGHLDRGALGLVTLVGLVTIGMSTYMILYSHEIYERLAPKLAVFDRLSRGKVEELRPDQDVRPDAIIFGIGRYGTSLAEFLHGQGFVVLGVDFDPVAVEAWHHTGRHARYGDANDMETPAVLPLSGAKWVVSTLPDVSDNRVLVQSLRAHGYTGRIALTARWRQRKSELEQMNPDVVFYPYVDAAQRAAGFLSNELRELR